MIMLLRILSTFWNKTLKYISNKVMIKDLAMNVLHWCNKLVAYRYKKRDKAYFPRHSYFVPKKLIGETQILLCSICLIWCIELQQKLEINFEKVNILWFHAKKWKRHKSALRQINLEILP